MRMLTRIRRSWRATALGGLLGLLSLTQAGAGTIVQEDFTGNATALPWIATDGACLTAGDSSTVVNSSGTGIPACGTTDYVGKPQIGGVSGTLPDPNGSGALRLTNDDNVFVKGGVIDTQAFPTDQGIQITFTTYTYDALQGGNVREYNDGSCPSSDPYCKNHGGDGMTFFLLAVQADESGNAEPIDASNLPAGGAGGSLDYSCNNRNFPNVDGMPNGYIGLGIDEGGFYLDNVDNTNTKFGYQLPETIGLRGAGNVNWAGLSAAYPSYYPSNLSTSNQEKAVAATCKSGYIWNYSNPSSPRQTSTKVANDYNYIASATLPSGQPMSAVNATTRGAATPITYRLIITADNKLSLDYEWGSAGFKNILPATSITATNGALPPFFRFGFAGAAGGASDIHEITCFEASPAARTIGSPVMPPNISGSSYQYRITSNQSPAQGYVSAYALAADGSVAATASWEAGGLMTQAQRQAKLYSTKADGKTPDLLTDLASTDAGAFTTNTCAPNATTIVDYTVDPNSVTPPSGCAAYLGTRASTSLLDEFSPGDMQVVLSPPNDVLDLSLAGYSTFAQKEASRSKALLFTNNDGFLYSIDASSGALNWGWMPGAFLGQLQNYSSWPYQDNFAGKFAAVDAYDSSATPAAWGTYLIGSANGGLLWYDLALDSTGKPSKVVTTFGPRQSTMPNNTIALPTGATGYPQRQAPAEANVNGAQMAAFLVNASTTSGSTTTTTTTLYEFNVATGAYTSAVIPTSTSTSIPTAIGTGQYVTSTLFYDPNSAALYFGTSDAKVYAMSFTGDASTDIGNLALLGSTQDGLAVAYVGYQQINNQPYLWAASTSGITVYGISASGFGPLWASADGKGYVYGSGGWSQSSSATVPAPLQATATISDAPYVASGVLNVPVYVPPSQGAAACNVLGEGHADYFALASGVFPKNTIMYDGKYLTDNLDLGQGPAYSPSIALSSTALLAYNATQGSTTSLPPVSFNRSGINTVVQWRVH